MATPQFFDPKRDFTVAWKTLPHWSQAGTVCFITWRTGDSLPPHVQREWANKRADILRAAGVADDGRRRVSARLDYGRRVSPKLASLPPLERSKLHWRRFKAWDEHLDRGAGACVLARPELSQIVADCLHHFEGDRYVLTDFVVMPNHVHILAALADEDRLLAQATCWKRFISTQINQALGRRGEFWQVEQFDHLVRSPEQFEYLRRYIADNPRRAGLSAESYRHYSKPF